MQHIAKVKMLCLIFVLSTVSAFAQKLSPRIIVGPNILVSQHEDYRHHESMLAANPTNPKNLVATSISGSRPDTGAATKTYASTDGGYTWTATAFPEQWDANIPFGAGDPQVAFGATGTAYFITLPGVPDKPGNRVDALFVYRSEDGGKHWAPPVRLPACDHPQIVVDKTGGKFNGNVYIGVLTHSNKKHAIGIFKSEDDGRSFEGPIIAVEAKDGAQVTTPVVLSDGTLFVPYTEFEIKKEGPPKYGDNRPIEFVTSSDGGRSFSNSQPIAVQHTIVGNYEYEKSRNQPNAFPKLGLSFDWANPPMFAGDSHGTEFRDRIYAVWNDCCLVNSRVLFTYSSDRGKSWTKPRPLSPDIPANAYQYQPALAVNNRGVLGIQWFDTRNSPKQDSYDLYFTASVDGGQSFLPVKRVTSESSFPATKGNLAPTISFSLNDGQSASLHLANGYVQHPNGGDYMLFEADSTGVFHPFWVDSRTGTQQLWTAHVRVEDSQLKPKLEAQSTVMTDVTKDILLVGGPIEFDAASNQAVIDIRLKNISAHPISGRLSVTVKTFGLPPGWSAQRRPAANLRSPDILNATNNKTGAGAVFDYSRTLGDFESLGPGEITEAIPWRLQLQGLAQTLILKVQVTSSGALGGK
ncbi:MAG: sialidase family protein [Acidobacteriia bacterium]|nr:sialidase family protein [Terriglobia bacterium]